ncbi:hypothetical protein [Nocardia sp. NPDC004860]|uniref:hypothetical protein n=1 Tax=Nocardia sp. NPDC004860 TaxID=3154557 RepID=UPI0033A80F1A
MINRLAPLTAIATGALFFPALLAPPASAAIGDFTAETMYGNPEVGSLVPCTTAGKYCLVGAWLVGEDQHTPASLTLNGRLVARTDDGSIWLKYDWTPATTGTYTFTATQGASTKTITVDITKVADTGSSNLFPTGSAS